MTDFDPSWTLKGLGAKEPFEHGEKLGLFGQFVGDWVGEALTLKEDGSEVSSGQGEVHFNWILDGRAIQDVWMYEDTSTKRMTPAGTTIRFYDAQKDNWQSTWISPLQNITLTFRGHEANGEIILEARNPRGKMEQWIFYNITSSSFSWRGQSSEDEGKTWRVHTRYRFKRQLSEDKAN
jgi:hypothetical protein